MTSLNNSRGQTFLEMMFTGLLITSFGSFSFVLILSFMMKNVLTRWANENSRCVAIYQNVRDCEGLTTSQLREHFFLSDIHVDVNFKSRGDIETRIRAHFLGEKLILADYTLQGSEYTQGGPQ